MSASFAEHTGPQSSLDRVFAALERAGCAPSRRAKDFKASCPMPGHADPGPSLHVTWRQGASGGLVLLRCFGCEAPAAELADALGLTMADLFDEPPARRDPPLAARAGRSPRQREHGSRRGHLGRLPARIAARPEAAAPAAGWTGEGEQHDWVEVAAYPYFDADGTLVQEVVRRECRAAGHRHKEFSQRYPTPGGQLARRKPHGFTPVLFRLPAVLDAVADGRRVLLLEGEKDVETAEALGLVATTNPGGGRNFPDHLAAPLAGADVDVVLDRDDTGWARGVTCHRLLTAVGARARLLLPAVRDAKADFTDHIAAGYLLDALVEVPARQSTNPSHARAPTGSKRSGHTHAP